MNAKEVVRLFATSTLVNIASVLLLFALYKAGAIIHSCLGLDGAEEIFGSAVMSIAGFLVSIWILNILSSGRVEY